MGGIGVVDPGTAHPTPSIGGGTQTHPHRSSPFSIIQRVVLNSKKKKINNSTIFSAGEEEEEEEEEEEKEKKRIINKYVHLYLKMKHGN